MTSFWQIRRNTQTQRMIFLKDMYMLLRTDKDVSNIFYDIEYSKFEYTADFHDSEIEKKTDKLLTILDLICEMHYRGSITTNEMSFFNYQIRRVAQNIEIEKYLTFLSSFYKANKIKRKPFSSFLTYTGMTCS